MPDNVYSSKRRGSSITTPGTDTNAVFTTADLSRVLPRQLSTGSTRGTQTVGYGTAKLDGSNNRITVGTPDGGTIGMGSIPGSATNEYGFFTLNSSGNVTYSVVGGVQYFYDDDGNLIQKVDAGTTYVYNPADSYNNVMQSGLLPDGSGGLAVAKTGYNVSDAITP
jgi:hypothetical protein